MNFLDDKDKAPFESFTGFGDSAEEDFHTWRSKGLGSSDMAAILKVSPYRTPYQLWLEKTGIKPNTFTGNYATQRGTDLEPMVRDWYNNSTNSNMIPERKVHSDFDFLRANADGVDHQKCKMIEIKCGNFEDHESGVIPEKYYPQCAFLEIVFGYKLEYVSYNEKSKEKFKIIKANISDNYKEKLICAAKEFWELVITKKPPLYVDADVIKIKDEIIESLVKTYGELKEKIDSDSKKLKIVQKNLSEKILYKNSECSGYKMTWVERKGNIDYSKVKGVNFEQYRKKPTRFFTVRKISE